MSFLPQPSTPHGGAYLRGWGKGGEWRRQALSWLSWEPLGQPALPPLRINLQWQLHCLPNPAKILGDDWPAPLCSINLWPLALRHQSQARGSGLTPAGASDRTPVRRSAADRDNLLELRFWFSSFVSTSQRTQVVNDEMQTQARSWRRSDETHTRKHAQGETERERNFKAF